MANIFTFNSTNVINYTFCILPVSKITASCITKCMTEPPMKIMMTRLKAVDQRYISLNNQ